MNDQEKSLLFAIECIRTQAVLLKEYSMRYEENPRKWPDLRGRHEKYQLCLKAIEDIEEMIRVKQGRFII